MKMKTYLITGGAGFIGSNFIKHILENQKDAFIINMDALTYAGNINNLSDIASNERYRFFKCDICSNDEIEALFDKYDIDYVVNFAAESHVDRSIKDPLIFAKTNIFGTMNLLNAAKRAWESSGGFKSGKKFLQVSTDEVYGSLGKEGYFSEATPLDPHSPYSASKASADMLVKSFFDTYRFPAVITRCSNNYGPYQFPEKLIPLMILNALSHLPLPVYGDGQQIRDWLYVSDHCEALETVLLSDKTGEVFNIGGNNEKMNIDIVRFIIKYLNEHCDSTINESLIRHVEDRKGHDRRYAIDASKIKEELGWQPKVSFEEGMKKTLDWYIQNKKWVEDIKSGEYIKYINDMYNISI